MAFDSLAVTKLPEIPMPMVPPNVLLNWCEAVATPRSELDRLFCTKSSVDIDTKPIPRPAMAKTTEHDTSVVDVEKKSVMPLPATSR